MCERRLIRGVLLQGGKQQSHLSLPFHLVSLPLTPQQRLLRPREPALSQRLCVTATNGLVLVALDVTFAPRGGKFGAHPEQVGLSHGEEHDSGECLALCVCGEDSLRRKLNRI